MKKWFIGMITMSVLASSVLIADPKMNKAHKAKVKDGAKVNCTYCHNSPGNIPKKRGQDIKALYKTKTCAGQGCHK